MHFTISKRLKVDPPKKLTEDHFFKKAAKETRRALPVLQVKLRRLGLHWLQLDGHVLIVVQILP